MNHFINYDANTNEITVNTYRHPGFQYGEIGDVADAVSSQSECVSCSIDGAKEALESDDWAGSSVTQEALTKIHDAISEY